METVRKIIGRVERLFAVISSKAKTVVVNILGFLSLRRIVMSLLLMMMFAPCLMNGAKSNNSFTVQAIDYSEPVQTERKEIRAYFSGSVVNDWREYSWTRVAPTNVIYGTSTFSAFCCDNYGTNFECWVTIFATGGEQNDTIIFNYGWSDIPPNNLYFPLTTASGRSIRVVFRFRYKDSAQNPPSTNMFTGIRFWINWDEPINYSQPQTTALPNSWIVDTTATQTTIATFTTSTEYYNQSQFDSFTETVKFDIATLFGMFDSGEGLIRVCNYLDSHLPYVYAISAFCGMMGIATVLLDW